MTLRIRRNLCTVAVKTDLSKVHQKKELIEIYKKAGSNCNLIGNLNADCFERNRYILKLFQGFRPIYIHTR